MGYYSTGVAVHTLSSPFELLCPPPWRWQHSVHTYRIQQRILYIMHCTHTIRLRAIKFCKIYTITSSINKACGCWREPHTDTTGHRPYRHILSNVVCACSTTYTNGEAGRGGRLSHFFVHSMCLKKIIMDDCR